MSFLLKVVAEASEVVAKPRKTIPSTPGGIYKVLEGPNPHKDGAKEEKIVTVIGPDRFGKSHGFYFFYGEGKPKGNANSRRIWHSNMFVWGIESVEKIGQASFEKKTYKGLSWIVTGIKDIDEDMASVDNRYSVFQKYATDELKAIYDKQEDINHHYENAKMVNKFCDWLLAGKKAADFKAKAKG